MSFQAEWAPLIHEAQEAQDRRQQFDWDLEDAVAANRKPDGTVDWKYVSAELNVKYLHVYNSEWIERQVNHFKEVRA